MELIRKNFIKALRLNSEIKGLRLNYKEIKGLRLNSRDFEIKKELIREDFIKVI